MNTATAKTDHDLGYDPAWNVRGHRGNLGPEQAAIVSEKLRSCFSRLARCAAVALGNRFADPAEAQDVWLDRVHDFHARRENARYAADTWRLREVSEASAEYCAELVTQFHEDGELDAEATWQNLEQRFREAAPEGADLAAIRRRDSSLQEQSELQGLRSRSRTASTAELGSESRTPQRVAVDNFIEKVSLQIGNRITRKDLWRVAGYREGTQFQRFQRGKRVSDGAASKFNWVLTLSPTEFAKRLKRP